ncbi:hypothetical protein [uncultured Sphingosinicella sp.]|jgi:hypothetical protein|uniref:hypothetical protein n=1 Tax=uncultured Sphingosinicella sp. TaxID=478748 RepID=UPI0030DD34A0|tara:strand:+ start:13943 stop:14626 length:684 start_codon:yes stop_codon:yes gene_type:complete
MKPEVIFVPSVPATATLARHERWMLAGLFTAAAALFVLTFLAMQPFIVERVAGEIRKETGSSQVAAFDIDAELADLMETEPVDLSAGADLPPADVFADAKGPPLNLLAQVERARVAVAALPPPVPTGPVLTEEEQMIVEANAERRAVKLALERLFARTENGDISLAAAVLVQPLLRRAEQAAGQLDVYGDALLLSEGPLMKQVAFAGFHASRAAAMMDIERAQAILG